MLELSGEWKKCVTEWLRKPFVAAMQLNSIRKTIVIWSRQRRGQDETGSVRRDAELEMTVC